MSWTDEQRAAIETLVARDGCCTVSTDDVSGVTERIGWNPPESSRLPLIERRKLQDHLAAVLEATPYDDNYGTCNWCGRYKSNRHSDHCRWALARAYLDSLNAE